MATGLWAFRRGQIGLEATSGTAVAATRVLTYDSMEIEDLMEFHEPEDERVSLSMIHRSQPKAQPPVKIAYKSDLLFEDIAIWLEGAVKGGVAPTAPDVAADLFTFAPNYATSNDLETFTVEGGDNEQEIEVPYCAVQDIEISWGTDEPVKVAVNLLGQRVVESTFTGALTSPTVETALGNFVSLYVDASWAGIGGTQIVGTLVEGKIKIDSGLRPVKRSDGTLYFTKAIENRRQLVSAEFTLEHDATSKAYRALYRADTKRFFEIRFTGSNLATTFDKFLKVQWCGPFRQFGKAEEEGGVVTVPLQSTSQYDATGTAEAKFLVQAAAGANAMFD